MKNRTEFGGYPERAIPSELERIKKCVTCGKEFSVYPSRLNKSHGHANKFCSRECYWINKKGKKVGKYSQSHCDAISNGKASIKEKCQSPIKLLIRENRKNEHWKKEVFKRDNWTCQNCGEKGYVVAHHIKPFAKIIDELIVEKGNLHLFENAMDCIPLWNTKNGITLCTECHYKVHGRTRRVETKRSAPVIQEGAIVRAV